MTKIKSNIGITPKANNRYIDPNRECVQEIDNNRTWRPAPKLCNWLTVKWSWFGKWKSRASWGKNDGASPMKWGEKLEDWLGIEWVVEGKLVRFDSLPDLEHKVECRMMWTDKIKRCKLHWAGAIIASCIDLTKRSTTRLLPTQLLVRHPSDRCRLDFPRPWQKPRRRPPSRPPTTDQDKGRGQGEGPLSA